MLFLLCSSLLVTSGTQAQLKDENPLIKWTSWALLQAIPSPGFYEDRNEKESSVRFGLSWQVIPVSFSFNANKYVSKFSFLHIKPNKRFSGSAEAFFEPAIIPGGFKRNDLEKFSYKSGLRMVIPISHRGEYLSFSLGAGYYMQSSPTKKYEGVTYEAGLYSFFGMMGLKFNYNQNAQSRYNFGLYIKYY
ncbi:MAG: hypothetical protein IAE90_14155 [Ignavibacteria bacterium]|nr:hypothetical protein [Ignavibacteria bacterium]